MQTSDTAAGRHQPSQHHSPDDGRAVGAAHVALRIFAADDTAARAVRAGRRDVRPRLRERQLHDAGHRHHPDRHPAVDQPRAATARVAALVHATQRRCRRFCSAPATRPAMSPPTRSPAPRSRASGSTSSSRSSDRTGRVACAPTGCRSICDSSAPPRSWRRSRRSTTSPRSCAARATTWSTTRASPCARRCTGSRRRTAASPSSSGCISFRRTRRMRCRRPGWAGSMPRLATAPRPAPSRTGAGSSRG